MLSTLSPNFQADSMLSSGDGIGYSNVFSSFQGEFTPWENLESLFVSLDFRPGQETQELGKQRLSKPKSKPNLSCHHAGLGLGLDDPNQISLDFCEEMGGHESPNQTSTIVSSGSDDPNQNSGSSNSGSSHNNDPSQNTPIMDERKRKRMFSNRESARKSRKRKQSHEENLRNAADRLKQENQEGANRLRLMTHNVQFVRSDNDRLMIESVILQRRLLELTQIWLLQQLHRNNNNYDQEMQIIKPNNEQIITEYSMIYDH